MATIRARSSDFTGTRAGVQFRKGVGETDNPRKLAWFARRSGYEIEAAAEPGAPSGPEVGKPLNKWTVAELKELAEELGMEGYKDLKKEPLLEAITAHYANAEGDGDEDADGDGDPQNQTNE